MTRGILFLPLALLAPLCLGQTPQPKQPLRAGCSPDDTQLGMVSADDTVEVTQALMDGAGTCYKITVGQGKQAVTGYVRGQALPAVAAFVKEQRAYAAAFLADEEQQQEKARQEALARAQATSNAAKADATAKTNPAAKSNPDVPAVFEEFSGRDLNGRPVSLSGLGGKLILVTFWSPRSATSKGQLLTVLPLYNQYKRAGLRAVGISMDPNPGHISDALDDMTLGWPQIPDRSGLAKRYGANAATGTTLVLDASHHILATGLSPAELQKKVRELLAAQ